jgi:hypothetical protein
MLGDILTFIRNQITADYLTPGTPHVSGNIRLAHVKEIKQIEEHLLITLINIEEEHVLKNQPNFERKNGTLVQREPMVYLNLFVLFTATHPTYDTAMTRLSEAIDFFQAKHFFSPSDAGFPANLDKLSFEIYSLKIEQLNHLWGILGGMYYPSVLYKVRVAKMRKIIPDKTGPEVTEIQIGTAQL